MKVGEGPTSTSRGRQAKYMWLEGIKVGRVRNYTVKGKKDILRLIN